MALKLSSDAGRYLLTTFDFFAWTIFLVTWGVMSTYYASQGLLTMVVSDNAFMV